jgi:hypothetical protein
VGEFDIASLTAFARSPHANRPQKAVEAIRVCLAESVEFGEPLFITLLLLWIGLIDSAERGKCLLCVLFVPS